MNVGVQVHAVGIMNALMGGPAAPALAGAAGAYREGLFGLARDGSAAVRRGVCAGIVQLLALQPEGIAGEVNNVVEYMLQSSQVRGRRPERLASFLRHLDHFNKDV